MAPDGLPHRAKPHRLHEICRLVRQNRGATRPEIYDRIDENQKTLRKTLEYGEVLGYLDRDGDNYELTERGAGISYSSSFEGQEAVIDTFREAIREYAPYREAIAYVYDRDLFTTVNDSRVVERDLFIEGLEASVGEEVENREVNVLIKTAEAAGLGEYKAGRRGYQTRLIIGGDFEPFASELAEEFALPEEKPAGESETPEGEDAQSEIDTPDSELKQRSLGAALDGGMAKLANGEFLLVPVNVAGKTDEEVGDLVKRLQRGDI